MPPTPENPIPLISDTTTPETPPTPDSPPTVIEMATQKTPLTPPTSDKTPKTQEQLKKEWEQRLEDNINAIRQRLVDLKQKSEQGEYNDKPGEEAGSGKKRLEAEKTSIQEATNRAKAMRQRIDGGQPLPQEEKVPQNIDILYTPSLTSAFGTPENGFTGTYTDPRTQDYAILKDDKESTKFGEYTLNPDTQNIDFEHIPESKIHIIDLSQFVGKPHSEVVQHIAQTYPNLKLPGLEYWKWLKENPTKTPNKLKDTSSWFYFPGSLVRSSNGRLCVPFAYWGRSGWPRNAGWLGHSWSSHCRVVLLEI